MLTSPCFIYSINLLNFITILSPLRQTTNGETHYSEYQQNASKTCKTDAVYLCITQNVYVYNCTTGTFSTVHPPVHMRAVLGSLSYFVLPSIKHGCFHGCQARVIFFGKDTHRNLIFGTVTITFMFCATSATIP